MPKHRSEIFKLSEEYFDKYLEYDTTTAMYIGGLQDYASYNYWNDYAFFEKDPFMRIEKSYQKKLNSANAVDRFDELARENILYDINHSIENANDYFYYGYWGSLFSEPEIIYEIFKEMPKSSKSEILDITKRMEKIPIVITQWITALKDVQAYGIINAKLRVQWTIDVTNNYANGKFLKLAKTIDPENERLAKAAKEAEASYEQLSAWLTNYYLPIASDEWRVGEERYLQLANYYAGTKVNPREIYEWGYKELEEINKRMWEVAKNIKPSAKKLIEIRDHLDSDPKYVIKGVDNFQKFLEGTMNTAIKGLHGKVFDIPMAARNCVVVMDHDTIDESPFYFLPSDDLTKPGRTIYPVVGRDEFTTWENYSTWFHESVPGHHMQFVTAILNKETLSKWQRQLGSTSGYAEGWALYSERLMDELGYFDDPGYQMGYLMCQAMRAARLVVDIGLHLGYKDKRGKVWTFDSAVKFMEEKALLKHRYAVEEIKRYISWAGQAISYKIGEKVWMDAREEAKARLGSKFNLKKFHMHALRLGPMTLDTLKKELAEWDGK